MTLFLTLGAISLLTNLSYSHSANQTGKCDSAYPEACLKSPPPNLNCPDIPNTDFKFLPPDPHGSDRDENGRGCKTLTKP